MNRSLKFPLALSDWWLPLLLIWLGLWLRVIFNLRMPLQWLEGWSILLAQDVLAGNFFTGRAEALRWLSGPMHALFYPIGPESVWLLRTYSALLAALNIAIAIKLGRILHSRMAGLTAGLLYVILPLMIFHERQALIDPIQATFTSFAVLFSVYLARSGQMRWAVLAGGCLAGAFLTKISALAFFAIPIWAVLLLSERQTRWQKLAMSLAALGVAAAVIVPLMAQFVRYKSDAYPSLFSVLVEPYIRLTPGQNGSESYRSGLIKAAGQFVNNTSTYVGPSVVFLTALSLWWLLRKKACRPILFLLPSAVLFQFMALMADMSEGIYRDRIFAARYILTSGLTLVVLAAISLSLLLPRLAAWRGRYRVAAALALLISIVFPAIYFDAYLIADPLHAPLANADRLQYIDGFGTGIGFDQVARTVIDLWHAEGHHPVNVVVTGEAIQLEGYLGPRVGEFITYSEDNHDQIDLIARWLADGQTVLFVDGNVEILLPARPHGAQIEKIGSYPYAAGRTINLYRVVGAGESLAERIRQQTR
jgi:hypothetical protein